VAPRSGAAPHMQPNTSAQTQLNNSAAAQQSTGAARTGANAI